MSGGLRADGGSAPANTRPALWLGSALLLAVAFGLYYLLVYRRLGMWTGLLPLSFHWLDVLRLAGGCGSLLVLLAVFYRLAPSHQALYVPEVAWLARGFAYAELAPIFIINAAAEEFIFRGALQAWLGLIPAALLFTATHISYYKRPLLLLDVFCTGIILGLIFRFSGSLWLCTAVHALYNIIVAWLIRSGRLKYEGG